MTILQDNWRVVRCLLTSLPLVITKTTKSDNCVTFLNVPLSTVMLIPLPIPVYLWALRNLQVYKYTRPCNIDWVEECFVAFEAQPRLHATQMGPWEPAPFPPDQHVASHHPAYICLSGGNVRVWWVKVINSPTLLENLNLVTYPEQGENSEVGVLPWAQKVMILPQATIDKKAEDS